MFLPGVEDNPQPSPYTDMIRTMQSSAGALSADLASVCLQTGNYPHLARFTQEVMREPSPLTPGLRELIQPIRRLAIDCPF